RTGKTNSNVQNFWKTLVQHIEERHRGKKLQAGCLMTTLRRKSWTTYSSSSDRTYNRGESQDFEADRRGLAGVTVNNFALSTH
ncbi:unnamed protein product, partial [Ectocarpus fasciculatus]